MLQGTFYTRKHQDSNFDVNSLIIHTLKVRFYANYYLCTVNYKKSASILSL